MTGEEQEKEGGEWGLGRHLTLPALAEGKKGGVTEAIRRLLAIRVVIAPPTSLWLLDGKDQTTIEASFHHFIDLLL